MRKLLPVLILTAFVAACGGESGSSVDERRQEACDAFAAQTPGILEVNDALEVLEDESSSDAERSEALKVTLDQQSAYRRTHPYDCENPADQELFEKHYGTFE